MIQLDELERDALTELINLGMGRAAAQLSRMVAEPVGLSVPSLRIAPRDEAAQSLGGGSSSFVAVSQGFQGRFSGRVLLVFPEANSLELVRAALRNPLGLEEVMDFEQEALAEIGNVLLSGCLSVIANALRETFNVSLPRVVRGDAPLVLAGDVPSAGGDQALLIYIDFSIRTRNIRGYIALLMDLPAAAALRALVRTFIDRVSA